MDNTVNVMQDIQVTQLIERCRRYERTAQRALYELYYDHVFRIAMRYANSIDVAREIVNDTFFRFFTTIDSYDASKVLHAWLRHLTICSAVDYFRKFERNKMKMPAEDVYGLEIEDDQGCFFDQFLANDLLYVVQQLPPSYRMVLILYAIDGYKHHEIAKMLGISIGTSKSHLLKARAKLRELLIQHNSIKVSHG